MTSIPRHTFPKDAIPNNVGTEICRLREVRGWTKAELAARSGLLRETISRIETGKRPPRADTLLRLARILLADQDDVELSDIVPGWPETDGRQVVGHGPRSRVRRQQLKLTEAEVAKKVGVSISTLSRFEGNTRATPTLLVTRTTPHGDVIQLLRSRQLAQALRFADLADHEAFCAAEDWLDWPVDPIDDAAAEDR
ncbi:helix-turn-helix domain-containing protein [Sphingomonas radiodurans]|uniref:helix-turn-helix domain-containing protein n=1 Tax=Sphingomonas radiodurans TaxID=2890321 RepID=UPI001E3C20B3|nr:helix-turn-helix transcriptional regulator [Sphingomonas radiodurans]WBH15817.1 helix-turn-helix transcriptional regulator [Sphingomonas radiodurans]